MNIPISKKEDAADDLHGVKIPDPFRWLEDGTSAEVKSWIDAQNAAVDEALRGDSFSVFSGELAKNLKVSVSSNPLPVNSRYFYTERGPDDDQGVLYVKDGLDAAPTVLFDPNGKRNGNTLTIDYWMESRTGRYVAYGISEGGNEMATIYVKNTVTGEELSDKIIHCRYSSLSWLYDDSGFYYTRSPRPGTVPKNEEHLHSKVYLHKLGAAPDEDILIFGEGRPKDDMIQIGLSPDGRYLEIHVRQKWTEDEIFIYDTQTKETKALVTGIPAKFSLRFLEDKVLMDTNYKANNHRLLWTTYADLFKPVDEWKEFIPERKFLLESVRVTKDKILVEYLVNVCSEVVIFNHEGKEIGSLPLPKYSSLARIACRRDEEEFFYGVESFTFPKIIYRYDPKAKAYDEYRRTASPIRPEDYEVTQEWYASKDGTRVPMFIFHKKGIVLDGNNPTLLYGYGGFGSNQEPLFMRNWVPWINRGGVFAIANIRGGGEFGDEWHKDGIKLNKQNGFDDFIAAAECLVSRKYASIEHLGIVGGSNGGLLVAAVAIERPDLFKAVCSRVPLTDMVRFHKFGIASRWIHEYGSPDIKEELESILKWSPYHNVKESVAYPSFLFTTGANDTRVDPLHARKMAAMLQSANPSNKALIFTEMEAGHGSGKPIVKVVESQALIIAFFAKELGLGI